MTSVDLVNVNEEEWEQREQFFWAEERWNLRLGKLTAQTGEVKPSTAACRPSAMNGMMFSPRRVSLYRALRMLSAWTWWHTRQHTRTQAIEMSKVKYCYLLFNNSRKFKEFILGHNYNIWKKSKKKRVSFFFLYYFTDADIFQYW